MKLIHFFWPYLEDSTPEKLEKATIERVDKLNKHIAKIKSTNWSANTSTALEEARRIAEEEDRRCLTSESKASIILTIIVALTSLLIPLLIYIKAYILSDEAGSETLKWITVFFSSMALLYIAMASRWALKVIKVDNYERINSKDLVKIWQNESSIIEDLVSETLISTRKNYHTINKKVTANKMAYAFLLRALVALFCLPIVQLIWQVYCKFY